MLTEEERETLDASLADSGCMGFLGDHPDLYEATETILARHVAEAERRGAERALRDAALDVFDTGLPAACARFLEDRADRTGEVQP